MRVIRSQSSLIGRNLAIEEWLLAPSAPPPPLLFLWTASPAVVIGKNQNPWMECAPGHLETRGIRLARRISGGGAVYHDPGNLNYAFILDRASYRRETAYDGLLARLRSLGIPAERLGRSGVGVHGRKFSGTAFCYRGERVLHHGTLLVSADLAELERALTPPPVAIRGRAVPSERSPVVNLSDVAPGLTIDRLADVLADGLEPLPLESANAKAIGKLEAKQASREWVYESTPPFEAEVLSWTLRVEKGWVALGPLAGCPFGSRDLAERLDGEDQSRILALGL
ncbi:MAG TPA: lipoate--protein ligase family protein [Kiritimatiellia bacterium]|nr:lipoate--protein ligase family protein [Kiritimatiellia bacterium]HRZ11271.1 lipoate--protein ligase family protein [Kiritimatiellia bacterium]HSA19122.1 lipoate--protein ligase family protein [Kiritimatiellia bacterium]